MTTDELYLPIVAESANTSSLRSQLLQSLKTSEEYRYAFVEEKIQSGLAAQIRAIREQRGMDPKKFAEKLGKKVSWVYRLEDPNLSPPTIPSLLEVARACGVDLEVRFRAFSGLSDDLDKLSPDSLSVPSFNEELPDLERRADAAERHRQVLIAAQTRNMAPAPLEDEYDPAIGWFGDGDSLIAMQAAGLMDTLHDFAIPDVLVRSDQDRNSLSINFIMETPVLGNAKFFPPEVFHKHQKKLYQKKESRYIATVADPEEPSRA